MGVDRFGRAAKPFGRWTADTELAFLLALRLTGQVRRAADEIGRSPSSAYKRRERDAGFAAAWDAAVAEQQGAWLVAQRAGRGAGAEARDISEADDPGGACDDARERADGWTAHRRTRFLGALKRTKCVRSACDEAGISDTAAYRLKRRSPPFARAWEMALGAETPSVIGAAYSRAVEGWDEPILRGGEVVGYRRRYSDALLRDLLRRERALELAECGGGRDGRGGDWRGVAPLPRATREETDAAILKKLNAIARERERAKAEAGAAEWDRWQQNWDALGRRKPQHYLPGDADGDALEHE
jgi:hypothetical protein